MAGLQTIRAEDAPHTAAAMLHLVPADQRLTPLRIFLHGDWLTKAVFAGLLAATAAAVGIWIVQQVRLRRPRPQSPEVALAFLSTVVITAPLLGLTRAAYETMKVCIGLVNLRPTVDIVMLAPAFAEASMSILLGVTAAAIAAAARGHLLMTFHERRRLDAGA